MLTACTCASRKDRQVRCIISLPVCVDFNKAAKMLVSPCLAGNHKVPIGFVSLGIGMYGQMWLKYSDNLSRYCDCFLNVSMSLTSCQKAVRGSEAPQT